jgi:hypothetical protein
VWVECSCPRASCGMNLRINGVGECRVCKALLCYKPSPRRKVLDFRGNDAWGWRPDPKGPERVHPEVDGKILEERGQWVKLPGTKYVFPRPQDRRRTARPTVPLYDRGERFQAKSA